MKIALWKRSGGALLLAAVGSLAVLAAGCADEAEIGVCEDGFDLNEDGVCDREVADWSADASIPPGTHRGDVYQLGSNLNEVATAGIGHALTWPVSVSGVLLPWEATNRMFEPGATDRAVVSTQETARSLIGFGTTEEMYDWLGLARADDSTEAWEGVAWPARVRPGDPLGAGRIESHMGPALSFSCATCHVSEFFGTTVVGMANRSARANEFFSLASEFFPLLDPVVFQAVTDATQDEVAMFSATQSNLASIGTLVPQVRGIDSSLAQVALSLSRRGTDEWATPDLAIARDPRPNLLDTYVADSKPTPWWVMKYKTRWLSDGSIISGNPIFTNFLWNELGRGTDLEVLNTWLEENREIADELTAAAFATVAPRWEDYLDVSEIDVDAAMRGQTLFEDTCARCHGTYEKGWNAADAASLSAVELIQTTEVRYHEQTPIFDVGTDEQRANGMTAFADRLNELAISQWMGTVVEVQEGYVPPPLDGIWARYPYLHNGSVPTLCDMLVPAAERTTSFYVGPADNIETDFDRECVGYPTGQATPPEWIDIDLAYYETSREGMSNQGHDEWLVDEDGVPVFSASDRMDIIEYLKTL